MTYESHTLAFLLSAFVVLPLAGERDVLNLEPVTANESVMTSSFREDSGTSFIHVSEALEGSLLAALSDSKKFTVVYRGKGSGPIAPALAEGVDQVRLVITIDDFQDIESKAYLEGLGEVLTKRTVRIGLVGSLFDVKTNEMKAATKVRWKDSETIVTRASDRGPVVRSNEILLRVSDEVSREVVTRCLDCLSPAKVMAITGKQITFNRGRDFGYPVGQIVEIFAVGEPLEDPDTGELLGLEEVLVGSAQVRRLTEKFSTAIIIEDHGIAKSNIVRLVSETVH